MHLISFLLHHGPLRQLLPASPLFVQMEGDQIIGYIDS